ncbi:hypothetical protein EV652_103121 [Kribbella steppae]|uniref:Uncharacterized protein n=1 Tax=Kribbella steppae TaxID=2512223 RepID=A0A4R2HPN0_9ACTN|nr:hypothetical protein EV652_103121 [Kribbella steppae]
MHLVYTITQLSQCGVLSSRIHLLLRLFQRCTVVYRPLLSTFTGVLDDPTPP